MPVKYRRLSFERLDLRLTMAAEVAEVAVDLVQVSLRVAAPVQALDSTTETPSDQANTLGVGDRFVVDVFIRESSGVDQFRAADRESYGIFQARIDLDFDPNVIRPLVDQVDHGELFTGQSGGIFDIQNGSIRELGGFDVGYAARAMSNSGSATVQDVRLVSIPFQVLSIGDPAIVPLTSQSPESFLGLGQDNALPSSSVSFDFNPIRIGGGTTSPVVDVSPPLDDSFLTPPVDVDATPRFETPVPIDTVRLVFAWSMAKRDANDDRWPNLNGNDRDDEDPARDATRFPDDGDPNDETALDPISIERQKRTTDMLADADQFWRGLELDLNLLDERYAKLPSEMGLRWFKLRLADDRVSLAEAEVARQSELAVPSVIDRGMADISYWLEDAKFQSWRAPHSAETRPVDGEQAESTVEEPAEETMDWFGEANVAMGFRLELIEESEWRSSNQPDSSGKHQGEAELTDEKTALPDDGAGNE